MVLRVLLVVFAAACTGRDPAPLPEPAPVAAEPPPEPEAPRTGIVHSGEGFVVRVWPEENGRGGPVELVVARFERGRFTGRVRELRLEGRKSEILTQTGCREPLVVTSGGFYANRDQGGSYPLGLVIQDGEEKNRYRRRRFGGFVTFDGANTEVLGLSERRRAEASPNALQSTPILLRGGRVGVGRDEVRFDRVAVGHTRGGDLVVAGGFARDGHGLSLRRFTELVRDREELADDPVTDLLALDGGPSAAIVVPGIERVYGMDALTYLPNAICIERLGASSMP